MQIVGLITPIPCSIAQYNDKKSNDIFMEFVEEVV